MDLADAYTEHALRLIRVANGQSRDVTMQINRLARQIRALLLTTRLTSIKSRKLAALIRQFDALVIAAYARVLADQEAFVKELVMLEAAWAARAGRYSAIDTAMLASVQVLVAGSTLQEHWGRQSMLVRTRIAAEVRLGVAAAQQEAEIAQRVVGAGPSMQGGVIDAARRDARGIVDATTHSAAGQGRLEAQRAAGVNAVKWFAILDTKVCPSCAARAEKLWDMDGKPIAHDLAFASPVLHPWCRCILLPMKFKDGPPADGGNTHKFEDWMSTLPRERQEDVLGVGRSDLWRRGVITTQDLIGQNGLVLPLRALKPGD